MNKDSESFSSGEVIEAPGKTAAIGTEFTFQSKPIQGNVPSGSATLKNWKFSEGIFVSIIFNGSLAASAQGSGVIVAPGVALCATHVIESLMHPNQDGSTTALCIGMTTTGLQIWHIKEITTTASTDIAILSLEFASALPQNNIFLQSIISTRTPKVGEYLNIFGFRSNECIADDENSRMEFRGDMWVSRGKVVDRFPKGRDAAFISWPAFAVDVKSHGGMSGGPVFDENGFLIGILSSSMDFEDGHGISYISMLWPVLTISFKATWLPGVFNGQQSLLKMDRKLCSIDKPDAVSSGDKNTDNYETKYEMWE